VLGAAPLSRQNEEWVWQHSPYTGGALLLHLAMADLANHQYHDEVWASDEHLSAQARISVGHVRRLRRQMIKDGFFALLTEGRGRGQHVHGRLLRPDSKNAHNARFSTPSKTAHPSPKKRASGTQKARIHAQGQLLNTKEHKETQFATSSPDSNPNGTRVLATDNPVKRCAHALTVFAFEQTPKPVTRGGFVAVMARIEEELRAGTTDKAIRTAIEAGDITWTADGLRTAISRAKPRRRRGGDGDPRTLPEMLADAYEAERKERRAGQTYL
jgi:hypothetical protein